MFINLDLRGKCKEMSEVACEQDSTLRLVRGHYYCPYVNLSEQPWWTVRPDGSIYDPTAAQFMSNGQGEYTEFDGMVECAECSTEMPEEEAEFYGSYAFCCGTCMGKFVDVI